MNFKGDMTYCMDSFEVRNTMPSIFDEPSMILIAILHFFQKCNGKRSCAYVL